MLILYLSILKISNINIIHSTISERSALITFTISFILSIINYKLQLLIKIINIDFIKITILENRTFFFKKLFLISNFANNYPGPTKNNENSIGNFIF